MGGLGWLLKRPESGRIESRLRDCLGRTRGSAMLEKVLSMAAEAKASSPPDFWLPEMEAPAVWLLCRGGLELLVVVVAATAGGAIGVSEGGRSRLRLTEVRGVLETSSPVVW